MMITIARKKPQAEAIVIECPAYLTPGERDEWDRIMRMLPADSCITSSDLPSIASLAMSMNFIRECREKIAKQGMLIRSGKVRIAHPLLGVIRHQMTMVQAISRELGLTPLARRKINPKADKSPSRKHVETNLERILSPD